MTIEEIILGILIIPICFMAVVAIIIELINFAVEKIELKNTIKEKDKIISAKNREIKALKELLEESECNVQALLREKGGVN
jgi:cell division protein FtsL